MYSNTSLLLWDRFLVARLISFVLTNSPSNVYKKLVLCPDSHWHRYQIQSDSLYTISNNNHNQRILITVRAIMRTVKVIIIIITIIIMIIYPRPGNTGLMPVGHSLISWGEGSSLALVGNPSRDGVSIKILWRHFKPNPQLLWVNYV